MKYVLLLVALNAFLSNGHDLPIISALCGEEPAKCPNEPADTPIPNGIFSWSNMHASCTNNNPTMDLNGVWNAWCSSVAGNSDADTYLQVNLGEIYAISKVGIRSRGAGGHTAQMVKTYNLEYGTDGVTFSSDGISNPLTGNTDSDTEVFSTVDIHAQYLRIIPVTFNVHKSLRFEAYGEPLHEECNVVDIDFLLQECSLIYTGVNEMALANKRGITRVNNRIDNLVTNSVQFYQDDPAAASAQSVYGMPNNYNAYDSEWRWYGENKENLFNLLMLSLAMNVCVIVCGSVLCLRAGVCAKAFGGKGEKYKVKSWASDGL